jgi:HAMP domain-containing protein
MLTVVMWVAVGLACSLLLALILGRGLRRLSNLDRELERRERQARGGDDVAA